MKMRAAVRFGNRGHVYVYYTVLDNLQRGDHVIVDSANGIGVAKFLGYRDGSDLCYSWILARIPIEELRKELEEYK